MMRFEESACLDVWAAFRQQNGNLGEELVVMSAFIYAVTFRLPDCLGGRLGCFVLLECARRLNEEKWTWL